MMREAKEAGVKCVVGGKGMLLWQGAEAFHLFTGQEMPVEEVKAKFFTEQKRRDIAVCIQWTDYKKVCRKRMEAESADFLE